MWLKVLRCRESTCDRKVMTVFVCFQDNWMLCIHLIFCFMASLDFLQPPHDKANQHMYNAAFHLSHFIVQNIPRGVVVFHISPEDKMCEAWTESLLVLLNGLLKTKKDTFCENLFCPCINVCVWVCCLCGYRGVWQCSPPRAAKLWQIAGFTLVNRNRDFTQAVSHKPATLLGPMLNSCLSLTF